jgi:histidinol-phosphate phosphatase family protein
VTNQPVLARGDCTVQQLAEIHAKLETVLGGHGAFLDLIEYCPHHPNAGYAGEVPSLKRACGCRKPEPGMLFKAALALNIDLAASWMVGDSTADIEAARRAGVTSVLVGTGDGGRDGRCAVMPDFEAPDVLAAARLIVQGYPAARGLESVRTLLKQLQPGSDWLLCGHSRSGKSTLAQVLARELRGLGQPCVVISLDRWIRSSNRRGSGFEGRHDISAIQACFQLSRLRLSDGRVKLQLPVYLRHQRLSLPQAETLVLEARTIVLWEGVSAIAIFDEPTFAGHRVAVFTDAEARRARVLTDLRARGDDAATAVANWTQRASEEAGLVAGIVERCDLHLSLDAALKTTDELAA